MSQKNINQKNELGMENFIIGGTNILNITSYFIKTTVHGVRIYDEFCGSKDHCKTRLVAGIIGPKDNLQVVI